MDLVLERKDQPNETGTATTADGGVMIMFTPPIDEDYWEYRVVLSESQAVIGFPKYSTIGIGFAVEEDWNTNLPYTVETERIFEHIAHNKADESISDDDVRAAIRLIQVAVLVDRGPHKEG